MKLPGTCTALDGFDWETESVSAGPDVEHAPSGLEVVVVVAGVVVLVVAVVLVLVLVERVFNWGTASSRADDVVETG